MKYLFVVYEIMMALCRNEVEVYHREKSDFHIFFPKLWLRQAARAYSVSTHFSHFVECANLLATLSQIKFSFTYTRKAINMTQAYQPPNIPSVWALSEINLELQL